MPRKLGQKELSQGFELGAIQGLESGFKQLVESLHSELDGDASGEELCREGLDQDGLAIGEWDGDRRPHFLLVVEADVDDGKVDPLTTVFVMSHDDLVGVGSRVDDALEVDLAPRVPTLRTNLERR